MKYKPEWKGRLKYSYWPGPDYGRVKWDGRTIGFVVSSHKEGAKSPGGMLTNTVFLAMRERLLPPYDGASEHASMTVALESLIPKE